MSVSVTVVHSASTEFLRWNTCTVPPPSVLSWFVVPERVRNKVGVGLTGGTGIGDGSGSGAGGGAGGGGIIGSGSESIGNGLAGCGSTLGAVSV